MNHIGHGSTYMAHGYCFLWQPGLVALHVVSDIIIGLSYYSLPVALFYFAYKRRDLPFYSMFLLFGLFIFSCGTTHFYGAYTVFNPVYWQEGAVKAITAVASAASAILFIPMLPKAIAMPSLTKSLNENRQLNAELTAKLKELNERTTELETANLELQLSESRFRVTFEQAAVGVAMVGTDLRWLRVNSKLCSILGYSTDELVGKMVDSNVEPFGKLLNSSLHDSMVEEELLRKDGTTVRVNIAVSLVRDPTGAPAYFITIIEDVTAQKTLEEQLRQSQKMEAIGQLAGGIAHDFNNILTVIGGYVSIVQAEMAPGDPKKQKLDQVLTATEKAANLTRSLLTFSRKQIINLQRVNLNNIVQNIREFLARVIGEDVNLNCVVKRDPLMVEVDSGQIEQVFVNLATNARDAMPKGGTLSIETDLQQVDQLYVRGHGFATPGTYVVFSVSDTGTGIDEDTQKKIFEPFFTTKEVGKGTGLGLSIIYGIVKQHNGYINVYSELGHGTVFRIYLPAAVGEGEARGVALPVAPPRGGSETILVAEDDPAVRKLVEDILTEYGYRVISAKDGQEAVEKYEECAECVALVLMDVIMPRKSGIEAYEEIKMIHPAAKVLFASGYTADFFVTRGGPKDEAEILMKPIQPMELLRKIREKLDG